MAPTSENKRAEPQSPGHRAEVQVGTDWVIEINIPFYFLAWINGNLVIHELDYKEVIKRHWSQDRKATTPFVGNQVRRSSRETDLVNYSPPVSVVSCLGESGVLKALGARGTGRKNKASQNQKSSRRFK